jgi:opacity protein-like surface antigen
MKRLLLLALFASSAMAQSNSVTLSIAQPRFSGESAIADGERIPVGMQSRTGFGIEAAHQFGRASVALAVHRSSSPVSASFDTQTMRAGSLTVTPISATFALHRGSGRIDPYAGAGIAYVMTGNLRSRDLDTIGLGRLSVSNDVTYLVNAGAGIAISPTLRLKLDARYMPVRVKATAIDATSARLKFNSLTTSAGLQWSF